MSKDDFPPEVRREFKRHSLRSELHKKAESCRAAAQRIEEDLHAMDEIFKELDQMGYHDEEETEELMLWAQDLANTSGDLGSELKGLRNSIKELKPELTKIVRVS